MEVLEILVLNIKNICNYLSNNFIRLIFTINRLIIDWLVRFV